MNICKSSIITVFLGCVIATQASASNKLKGEPSVYGCQVLIVHISERILDEYFVSTNRFVISNGIFLNCFAINTDINNMDCLFRQNTIFGPDATLLFERKADGQIAKIRVQQNFCFWEAGNITVEPIRGEWIYSTHEGSFDSLRPGNVWLEQVSLKN